MALEWENIRFVPCAHRRVTFAEEVRRAAYEFHPDVIAVEWPDSLRQPMMEAISCLPAICAVCYESATEPQRLYYIPADPCDAMVEAVRLGMEHQLEIAFIDLDLEGFREPYLYVPDDLIVEKTSLEDYVTSIAPYLSSSVRDKAALAREAKMARELKRLNDDGKRVLCVLGLAHYARVQEWLAGEGPIPKPEDLSERIVKRRPEAFVTRVSPSGLVEALGEIPYLSYLYQQNRREEDLIGEAAFDKLGAVFEIFKQAEATYEKTYKAHISMPQRKALLQYGRNLAMVQGRLRPDFLEIVIAARGIVDGDYGYEVFELARSYPLPDVAPGVEHPAVVRAYQYPQLHLNRGKGSIEGREEKFRMSPRVEEAPTEMVRLGFRRRPPQHLKQLWKEQWDNRFTHGICSWPPEDEIQEHFMDYVRKRALQTLSEDRRQVEEFSTTILDGLDIRETVRQWHRGKLFVQSTPQPQGRCGAVVIIFDDVEYRSPDYSWRCTLYAENQNESDISFFASELGQHVVGPRIARTEFGGFLSIFPSLRIPDIWLFDVAGSIRWCSEVLMAGAIIFSPDRYVAYVSQRPPTQVMRQLASVYQKQIIYLPLNRFASNHLSKIRRFHILDGYDVRKYARDYIFDD